MKACPDCAELVLEAARKCRYCGYEFAPAPPRAVPGNSLIGFLLRRPTQRLSMTETLAQLGVDLDPGEQPTGLWLARAYSSDGYVVLTSERLFFVAGLRRPPSAPAPRQHSLHELAGAEVTSRHRKSALVLHWRDSPDLSVAGLAPRDLRQLHGALLSALAGNRN